MKLKIIALLILPIFLLTSIAMTSVLYVTEERQVLSRNYVGLGVEVFAPYRYYPGEDITIRVRVEALENVKNASAVLFLWSSQSEGSSPWGTSFTVLDISDFPDGTIEEEAYNVTIPSNIDAGLTYGILFIEWSVFRAPSWEDQWDKASFRATYVQNRDFENLQKSYNQLAIESYDMRILIYIFVVTTIGLAVSIVYLAKKRK